MKVVFMGTPEFAVATLDAICQSEHEVAAVVTVPDKPAGRGLKLRASAVKEYASAHNLTVLQPEKLKSEEFLAQLRAINADIFVVVAFRMLPEVVYAMPRLGTFNVHASLLPNYRGAAPIHWAIMNGETRTGVTTFFLNQQIDTGDIIAQTEIEIGPEETTGELYERLMKCGAQLALDTLDKVEKGAVTPQPQNQSDEATLKPAPKIFKEDTFIDWNDTAVNIFNKIRGLNPAPCACTRIQKKNGTTETLKIYEAEIVDSPKEDAKPGQICVELPNLLTISAKDRAISIKNLQLQGKTRLDISDFLRGFHFENYTNILF